MSDREKPWEERWNLSGVWWSAWPPEEPTIEYRAHNDARMKLAECAPEMYRKLVELREKARVCPDCYGAYGHHDDDCGLQALLRRARGE